ncbi:molybdopterin synthase sulfur carrier subunit [Mycolicibacter terrae]|jgi:molybdopterin converting factor small subunit|uniref:Molybdopterin synthase sulfur carrier subunit n=1 Tax=Mycolicibacter terrae TaxID=1788 RepID=A0AAD1MJC6_9MYCO|nr:MoaD/ThiS family protein [Mycolicibacter terrae]ORW98295.1 molybdopterin synthase sulfur carrier subunit [Mycolicibacter terrae]BBX23879.1 molybdopterin synthase sulfur carrier subunit [Mycolicibacter terrae]SNV58832.1 molybdenum cofactor biosynthesis protein D 2 MoaD2 [Mycolicibacter terrae]
MTQQTDTTTAVAVTVRYFAAARAAAGVDSETVSVPAGAGVAELADALARGNDRLATVLDRCSYLRDGVAVRDRSAALLAGETVDVLPPFAGG